MSAPRTEPVDLAEQPRSTVLNEALRVIYERAIKRALSDKALLEPDGQSSAEEIAPAADGKPSREDKQGDPEEK